MKFHFRDINPELEKAWRKWFDGIEGVTISTGDIWGAGPHDAIVSPANSFGFMDGGIDMIYSIKFGWGVQERLQKLLREEHDGELPIGQAVIVETGHKDWPYCVSAPTMRVPTIVSNTPNAFLAFRAVIRSVKQWNKDQYTPNGWTGKKIETVLCPGLGTAVGRMPAEACAKQMFAAYMTSFKGEPKKFDGLHEAVSYHFSMLRE